MLFRSVRSGNVPFYIFIAFLCVALSSVKSLDSLPVRNKTTIHAYDCTYKTNGFTAPRGTTAKVNAERSNLIIDNLRPLLKLQSGTRAHMYEHASSQAQPTLERIVHRSSIRSSSALNHDDMISERRLHKRGVYRFAHSRRGELERLLLERTLSVGRP